MTSDPRENTTSAKKSNSVLAGISIALLGPPIGTVLLLFGVFLVRAIIEGLPSASSGMVSDVLKEPLLFLFGGYLVAGIPAIIAGIYAAIRIEMSGWISAIEMSIVSIVGSIVLVAIINSGWFLLPLVVLTAFILRYLLLRWGVVNRPSNR